MEKIVRKVLNLIEREGYEAYIVGGYVRDFILDKKSFDVDICTNALPKELKRIFPSGVLGDYGTISFKIKQYDFEITTYRREKEYENRRPKEVIYIDNLIEDLSRRDFKFNTICMNSKGLVIDLLDGYGDISSRTINVVGDNIHSKFTEDPLRMLRAIRFATLLDFELSEEIKKSIKLNKRLIGSLSKNRIKTELDKILISEYSLRGISLLKEFGILDILELQVDNIVKVSDLLGMYSQFENVFILPFTKEEKNNIITIKEITKKGIIDENVLFENDLYLTTVAGSILNYDNVYINKLYKSMPIYNVKDLCLNFEDIKNYLKIDDGKEINKIIHELCDTVLNKGLKNNKKSLYNYLLNYKEKQL